MRLRLRRVSRSVADCNATELQRIIQNCFRPRRAGSPGNSRKFKTLLLVYGDRPSACYSPGQTPCIWQSHYARALFSECMRNLAAAARLNALVVDDDRSELALLGLA